MFLDSKNSKVIKYWILSGIRNLFEHEEEY